MCRKNNCRILVSRKATFNQEDGRTYRGYLHSCAPLAPGSSRRRLASARHPAVVAQLPAVQQHSLQCHADSVPTPHWKAWEGTHQPLLLDS